jgi:hypothetical protein
MDALINLEAMARAFVSRAIAITQHNLETDIDAPAIRAVHGQIRDNRERESALKKWLRDYAVFQGFTAEMRADVVRRVLQFADDERCHSEALSHIGTLQGTRNQPRRRDVTSLTTKALWCCYPNAVPIYDRLAQNALWVMCKLARIQPTLDSKDNRYETFSDVWLQIYAAVEGIITAEIRSHISHYPYKVRVFDRILWSIGQPNYTGKVRLQRNLIV